jgi:hypothetical protein
MEKLRIDRAIGALNDLARNATLASEQLAQAQAALEAAPQIDGRINALSITINMVIKKSESAEQILRELKLDAADIRALIEMIADYVKRTTDAND